VLHGATALVVAALLGLTACSGTDAEPSGAGSSDTDPILIGEIASLTGDYQNVGTASRAGADYAVKVINASGGVLGRELQLDVRDDQSVAEQAAVAFKDLAANASVFIGPGSANPALAVADLADDDEIPVVSPAVTEEQINPVRDFVFQVPGLNGPSIQLANYYEARGFKKVFVVLNAEEGGLVAGWEALKSLLDEQGVEVVDVAEVGFSTTDYAPTIAQAAQSGADVIAAFVAGPPGVAFATQLDAADIATPVTYLDAVASDYFVRDGGKAVNGSIIPSPLPNVAEFLPESELSTSISDMIAGFTEETGQAPDIFSFFGYATVQVIAAAIEEAGSADPAAIQAALSTLSVDTVIGPIAYSDSNHAGPGAEYVSVNEVVDNQLVPTEWSASRLTELLQAGN